MNLERILSVLDENKTHATVDAVAELTGEPVSEVAETLLADPERARWVFMRDDNKIGAPAGPDYVAAEINVPIVIRDATRLRMLVLATELTATIP